MRNRNSLLLPLGIMLAGVLFQLKALGIIGTSIPDSTAAKFWPLLLAAAGLDLLLCQRRLVGGVLLLFCTLALFAAEFLETGWNCELWKLFLTFWPILLILFGLDIAATGRSIFNVVAITLLAVAFVYALLMTLGIPVMKQIPNPVANLQTMNFTSDFNTKGLQFLPETSQISQGQTYAVTPGEIALPLPAQNAARIELNAALARISLKGGNNSGLYLSGTLSESLSQNFQQTTEVNASQTLYKLNSPAASGGDVNMDLTINPQVSSDVQLTLQRGYIKADLSQINLSVAMIKNQAGPIDVQLPAASDAAIQIIAENGDIRVFLPRDGQIYCKIYGTSRIDYPRDRYQFNGNTLIPIGYGVNNPITVEISSQNGMVQIIGNE